MNLKSYPLALKNREKQGIFTCFTKDNVEKTKMFVDIVSYILDKLSGRYYDGFHKVSIKNLVKEKHIWEQENQS